MKARVVVEVLTHTGPPDLRVGVDVVRRGRLEAAVDRLGPRFATTIFHPGERGTTGKSDGDLGHTFAAKEALAKAIGTGVVSGVELPDIEAPGAERLVVHGALRLALAQLGWHCWVQPLATEAGVGAIVWVG